MTALLEVRSITKRFGGLTAIDNVSFDVAEREILSVIGPNGAGKSTLFKMIASFVPTDLGRGPLQGRAHLQPRPAPRGPQGRGPHLPGDHDLPLDERARERHHRPPPALARRPRRLLPRHPDSPRGRGRLRPLRRRDHPFPRPRRRRGRAGLQPPAGPPPRPRHGHRPRHQPHRAAARRAVCRHEPRRDHAHGRPRARRPRPRRHRAPRRARHAGGDADLRPYSGAQLRPEDRRGHPLAGAAGRPG